MSKLPLYENTNGMPLFDGKNLHMEICTTDISNRIITVGHLSRAIKIAKYLTNAKTVVSSRGFTTISGFYTETFVSVVAIGMGSSMMDFFVRETRAIVTGPLIIIRFGTCGGLTEGATPGTVVVSSFGSGYVYRNPDYFSDLYGEGAKLSANPYITTKIAPCDKALSKLVFNCLQKAMSGNGDSLRVIEGINVSADSFYSSQGRKDGNFLDDNSEVFETIHRQYNQVATLEMETFTLFHLAQCNRTNQSSEPGIICAAAVIVVANRVTSNVVEKERLELSEELGGKALLDALVMCK